MTGKFVVVSVKKLVYSNYFSYIYYVVWREGEKPPQLH